MAEALATKSPKGKSSERAQKRPAEHARQPAVPTGPYGEVLALQRSAGNRVVSQLLESGMSASPFSGAVLQRKCASCANSGSECAECRKKRTFALQPKLTINEPGDRYEQEADRIADQVMATPARPAASSAPPRIQRLSGEAAGRSDAVPNSVHQTLASPGRLLDPATRAFFEPRFGHDFSHVRVHTDGKAAESARAINALAYTIGRNVAFGAGQYSPGTSGGQRLLAHELTHVVQQRRSDNSGPQIQRIPKSEDEMKGSNPRYSYSENCGWIDWGHVNPKLAKSLIESVTNASRQLFKKEGPQRDATYHRPKLIYQEKCPKRYAYGEQERSKRDKGTLEIVPFEHGIREYHLGGFEIGKSNSSKFDQFKDAINDDLRAVLEAQNPPFSTPYEIYVDGFTDCLGSTNAALREQRAKSIFNDLLYTGMVTKYYRKSYKGATFLKEFIDTNDTEEGRRKNRGVIIEALPDYTVAPEDFETPYMESRFVKGPINAGVTRVKSMFTLYRSLDYNEILGVSLWIFKNLSIFFEEEQLWTERLGHSYFSEEDLPSNLISFYMAANNVKSSDVRSKVDSLCKLFPPDQSINMFRMYHFQRNKTFLPRDSNTWPAEFSTITPIAPGKPIYEPIGYEGSSAWSWFFQDAQGHRSER